MFNLTEEQDSLQQVLRELLGDRGDGRPVRDDAGKPLSADDELWSALALHLGLAGLAVEERLGGVGADRRTVLLVLEELGYHLAPSPFLATSVLAPEVLGLVDPGDARDRLLSSIAGGEATATIAFGEGFPAPWPAAGGDTVAEPDDEGGWRISGTKTPVIDGDVAEHVIVLVSTPSGPGLFVVDGDAAGLSRTRLDGVDESRRLAELRFDGTPATPLPGDDIAGLVRRARDLAQLALAAEGLGVMRRSLETANAYALERYQFNRPIGSFQAIKHRLATMKFHLELAESVVAKAAAASPGSDEESLAAAVAHVLIGRGAKRLTDDSLHVHGGLGFTWEHDAHLYLRRAWSSYWLAGDPNGSLDRIADILLA
jgi:acyl-CoA dehydrogenase